MGDQDLTDCALECTVSTGKTGPPEGEPHGFPPASLALCPLEDVSTVVMEDGDTLGGAWVIL